MKQSHNLPEKAKHQPQHFYIDSSVKYGFNYTMFEVYAKTVATLLKKLINVFGVAKA